MLEAPEYDITRTIGSGAFGFVFEAVDRKSGKKVALKRIQKVGKGMSRENEMLYMLKGCPNVIQIQKLFYTQNDKGKLVQNIVFEFFEDNLENIIQGYYKKSLHMNELTIKTLMFQLLNGLKYVHQKQIAHRDLKPQNILVGKQSVVKICDFGCSKIIDPKGINTPYVMSRYYRAPQLIMGITKYSVAVDLWSVGCIMAELALLQPLFVGKDEGDQLFAILKIMGSMNTEEENIVKKRVPFQEELFKSFRGFKRINLHQRFRMVKHNKDFVDLLTRMLTYLPQHRIKAAEALEHSYFRDLPMHCRGI